MRREFLKGYIMSLIAEGELVRMPPSKMARKVAAMIAKDVPEVLTEMASIFAEQGFRKVSSVVMAKLDNIAADLGRKGIKTVWAELQEQYKRGVEANTGGK